MSQMKSKIVIGQPNFGQILPNLQLKVANHSFSPLFLLYFTYYSIDTGEAIADNLLEPPILTLHPSPTTFHPAQHAYRIIHLRN